MAGVLIGRRGLTAEVGGDGWGGPVEGGADGSDVAAPVLGPGDAGGGEEQCADEEPDAGGGVPGEDAPVPLGSVVRADEVPLGAGRADAGDPEAEADEGDDTEPGGGEFAVEASDLDEVQVAVQLVDLGAQR